jgi:hypothetical protein
MAFRNKPIDVNYHSIQNDKLLNELSKITKYIE